MNEVFSEELIFLFELIFLLKITKSPIRLKDPRIFIKFFYLVGEIYKFKYFKALSAFIFILIELFLKIDWKIL